jgi:MoaA/NifB/PqqE/SkfB family radical SAM enzyme
MDVATFPSLTDEEQFVSFLKRGKPPCDYGRQLMTEHFDRVEAILEGKVVPPYEIEIQPSANCNLRCKHCLGRDFSKLGDILGFREMVNIAKQVDDFRDNGFGIETVKFCGTTGEPLMNPVVLPAIEIFKGLGKKVILFTNGLSLGKKYNGGKYLDYVAKADKINISLDAGSEEVFKSLKGRGGFEEIIKGARELRAKSGLNIVVSYVIGKENYCDVARTAGLVKDFADEIRYRIDFMDVEDVRSVVGEVFDELEIAKSYADDRFRVNSVYSDDEISTGDSAFVSCGRKCFNHHFWACVGPDANLYACGHRAHGGVKSYGNLMEKSLREIWVSEERRNATAKLPDEYCFVCSPSSKDRNDFMTFLSGLGKEEVARLKEKYTP